MKLYYKPGACSLASHIALKEADASFQIEKVDTNEKKTESGEDYSKVNPNGYVPALLFDDGEVLTEGPAILAYIAETNPAAGLLPAAATRDRARVFQHLNFVGSELHKAFSPFFAEKLEGDALSKAKDKLHAKLDHVESVLADGREFLVAEKFSIADAYLFVVASWAKYINADLANWPRLAEFVKRVADRPAVRAALAAEGLA